MTHTTNYNLNKFEATDRVTRDGFNDNADAIDTALKSVSDAASTAQSAAATAQSTANTALAAAQAAAAAGCRVVIGTYTGTGGYHEENSCQLTFNAKPYLLFIGAVGLESGQVFFSRGADIAYPIFSSSSNIRITWGEKSVQWYSDYDAKRQMNTADKVYHYVALLMDA